MEKSGKISDEEADKVLCEILEEDEEEDSDVELESCPADCADEDSASEKVKYQNESEEIHNSTKRNLFFSIYV